MALIGRVKKVVAGRHETGSWRAADVPPAMWPRTKPSSRGSWFATQLGQQVADESEECDRIEVIDIRINIHKTPIEQNVMIIGKST